MPRRSAGRTTVAPHLHDRDQSSNGCRGDRVARSRTPRCTHPPVVVEKERALPGRRRSGAQTLFQPTSATGTNHDTFNHYVRQQHGRTTPSVPSRCGHCGWPLEDTPALSIHRTSEGPVSYRRCVCGRISLERNGTVLGGAGPPTQRSRPQVGKPIDPTPRRTRNPTTTTTSLTPSACTPDVRQPSGPAQPSSTGFHAGVEASPPCRYRPSET